MLDAAGWEFEIIKFSPSAHQSFVIIHSQDSHLMESWKLGENIPTLKNGKVRKLLFCGEGLLLSTWHLHLSTTRTKPNTLQSSDWKCSAIIWLLYVRDSFSAPSTMKVLSPTKSPWVKVTEAADFCKTHLLEQATIPACKTEEWASFIEVKFRGTWDDIAPPTQPQECIVHLALLMDWNVITTPSGGSTVDRVS